MSDNPTPPKVSLDPKTNHAIQKVIANGLRQSLNSNATEPIPDYMSGLLERLRLQELPDNF